MTYMFVETAAEDIATLQTTIIIVSILAMAMFVLLIAAVTLLHRIQKRNRILTDKLKMLSDTRNNQLAQFMELCAAYVSRISAVTKGIESKIRNGKADEVARQIRSGKYQMEQSDDFFRVFDKVFLSMHPNFIATVNALMQPEYGYDDNNTMLNTDLRILAFMVMGMHDTQQIAQMMGYSVNTVYAYRTRLRNHALNKDTFEADLLRGR